MTREEALRTLKVFYPGENATAGQWIAYGELEIKLASEFNITEEELINLNA